MKHVSLGNWIDKGEVKLDLPRLLITRLLIQANSGSGKSWALRRLLEATAGLVQQLIIDPEGEFATLREKHDLVIISASGGDALAHPKTAALLAQRLLETQASAVLDISDLKANDRHSFVRLFLEALIEAPKALRHSVLVVLDEAQMFVPEKGQGESEASAAVIDVATRGRKRGLCLVAATQRISMLHKGVAAECKNRMIGGTSLDVDVKRAAFDLGLPPAEALKILRALEPGHFYAFGPAFHQLQPREFVTGEVHTSHPKVGHRQAAPPAPTQAILALLPKLADLPKEAEQQAKSIEELRRELTQTKRELTLAKKAQPTETITKPQLAAEFKRGITEGQTKGAEQATAQAQRQLATERKKLVAAIEDLMKFIVKINVKDFAEKAGADPEEVKKAVAAATETAMRVVERNVIERRKVLEKLQSDAGRLIAAAQKLLGDEPVTIAVEVKHNEPFTVKPSAPARTSEPRKPPANGSGDRGELQPVQARILDALAEAEQLSAESPDRSLVAILSGYTHIQSTGFVKALGALSSAGLIVYPPGGRVALTESGRGIACAPDRPTTAADLQQRIINLIGGAASKVLKPLIDANLEPMSRQDLATASGYGHVQSTGFVKTLGRLRTLGFIDYPDTGMVVAKPVLFLEGP